MTRRLERVIRKPIVIAGSASPERLKEMICAVTVVPMFAPKMMPIDWTSDSNPALMKPITITVVALEDWITAVTRVPASTATMPFRAKNCSSFFMFSPAIFWMPSPISFMPKTKRLSPPSTLTTTPTRLKPKIFTGLLLTRKPLSGAMISMPIW